MVRYQISGLFMKRSVYSDEVTEMAGLYRRYQPFQALCTFISNPFILGIIIGILFNLVLR